MKTLSLLVSVLVLCGAAGAAAETSAPYAGWQARDIKALSQQQIDDLRAGRGMGLALAAELNGYPGPRHVLDLGDDLGLAADQRAAVEALFQSMQTEAQRLGDAIVAEEAALDAAFRSGRVDEAALGERTARLGFLQGELRLAHLSAHLAVRPLLSPSQIAHYNVLRGYVGDAGGAARRGHGHQPAHP